MVDDNLMYPGKDWMPVENEEIYSPGFGNYGTVKHVNGNSAIIHFPDMSPDWIEVYFDDFHKSRRDALETRRGLN